MRCKHFNDVSDEWIQEKTKCTNLNARLRVREIQKLIGERRDSENRYLTAQEFTAFLRFKGLARITEAFLSRYASTNEVELVTSKLFTSELSCFCFEDTMDVLATERIADAIASLLGDLQGLDFVGVGVASACLALCFPDLCGTADYIVPAMLHNEHDQLGNPNPLFASSQNSQRIRKSLLLPVYNSLTPKKARELATGNYARYVQELWKVKHCLGLRHKVREIEVAFWSFGICYLKKRDERLPLEFSCSPNPPPGGPFSKHCPDDA